MKGVIPLVLQLLQLPPRITVDIFLLGIRTLVVLLLAPTEGDLHLHQVALEVDGGGDEGEAPLVDLALELLDLSLVGKQAPVSQRFVVVEVAMGVGLYGQSHQRQGVVAYGDVAVGEAELTLPDGLHLGAHQRYATLKVLHHFVVEVGLSILLQEFDLVLVLFHLVIPGDAKPYEVSAGSSIDSSHRMYVNGGGSVQVAPSLDDDI